MIDDLQTWLGAHNATTLSVWHRPRERKGPWMILVHRRGQDSIDARADSLDAAWTVLLRKHPAPEEEE